MFRIIESIVDELVKKALKNFMGEKHEINKENNVTGSVQIKAEENNNLKNNSSKTISLIPNRTKFYHKTYGEGTFIKLEEEKNLKGNKSTYIYVEFENAGMKVFSYPDALGKYLFFDKPDESEAMEMFQSGNVSIANNRVNIIKPTEEQIKVVEAIGSINMISVNAFAGTGKTTTLALIVERYKNRKIMVLAFNRAMAEELEEKFSKFSNVEVYTTHSLAYRHVRKILEIEKIEDERALPKFIKEQLRIEDFSYAAFLGKLLVDYCRSAETGISVDIVDGLIRNNKELYAYYNYGLKDKDLRKIANNLKDVYEKAIKHKMIFHDLYLKYFQVNIGKFLPLLRGYYGVLLDEAQDTNPVTFDLFMKIPAVKKVIVGDRHQNIYSWRGARNYLSNSDFRIFYLTETFRFGENIANAANKILKDYKGETHYIKPSPRIKEGNGKIAYITRTNSRIIELISKTQENKVAFLRSLDDIFRPVFYAREIIHYYKFGRFHGFIELPEYLIALVKNFKTIKEFEGFCNIFDREMYVAIQIANRYDIDTIRRKAESLYNKDAKTVFATAHTTKGLEFEKVVIENDFPNLEKLIYEYALIESKKEIERKVKHGDPVRVPDFRNILLKNVEKIRRAIKEDDPNFSDLINEVNLQYVAITRAQKEAKGEFYNNLTKQDIEKFVELLRMHFKEVKKAKDRMQINNFSDEIPWSKENYEEQPKVKERQSLSDKNKKDTLYVGNNRLSRGERRFIMNPCINCKKYSSCEGQVRDPITGRYYCDKGYIPKERMEVE
ncbi:MAG TPA: AAA family ATPase [Fervidobacterium sp.]|nr:AAA family ATPase [Fervidobacterium sp.]